MIGSKYDDQDRTKAMHLLAKGMTPKQISAEMDIPITTLYDWKSEYEEDEKFVKLRNEYKKRFEETVSRCIDSGTTLIQKTFDRALAKDDVINKLFKDAEKQYASGKLSDKQFKAFVNKLNTIKCDDVAKIASAVGILYDKRALSQGKETAIVGVKSFEDMPE